MTVFSFPPDKGNVGTAAYLNVFGSIFKVLQNLKREGYDVGELPESGEGLIQSVSTYISADSESQCSPMHLIATPCLDERAVFALCGMKDSDEGVAVCRC